jgi:hypothetical protein
MRFEASFGAVSEGVESKMTTTQYFEEVVVDQGGEEKISIEFGRSSFYAGCPTPSGTGEDSIYLKVDGKSIIMDQATAKKFVEAAMSVGHYFRLID